METSIVKHEVKPIIPIINGQLVPQDFDGLYRLAQIMAASGMVPKSYERKPEAIFVAVQMGMEIGLSPMASVQNIAVINGMPSIWGDAALAIVSGSGLLDDFSEVQEGDINSENCMFICTAIRKGRPTPIIRDYSVSDAKKAGLWGKNTWANHPKRMLQMRARSRCLRDGFPDLLKGIKISEESMDYDVDMKVDSKGVYSQTEKKEIKPGNTEIYKAKQTKEEDPVNPQVNSDPVPTLNEEIQKQINECFLLDVVAAKSALIETGTDSIGSIRDEKQAEKFLKTFNQMIDEEFKG